MNLFRIHENLDATIGKITQHTSTGTIVRGYDSQHWNPYKLKIGYMPPHPSIFLKRSLFKKLGYYYTDMRIGADYELITRFFLKHKINWKYSGLTTTRMLIGGVSSSGIKSYLEVTKDIFKSLDRNYIMYDKWKVRLRLFWKVFGLISH